MKKRLLESVYVDNVVTSVGSKMELDKFFINSKALITKSSFDLREWKWHLDCNEIDSKVERNCVLGLIWKKELDFLSMYMKWLDDINVERIIKRKILPMVHKVFGSFDITSPVKLCPKIMLQKAWKSGGNEMQK